ncbi:hypothetical protein CCYA_CCYA17G4282 [Cyanidiococcus yangmingshanensis]|nr:hypothetical protein CCYA_CCYA17G4282 [Cyanidiococcus yangmingshanensis]
MGPSSPSLAREDLYLVLGVGRDAGPAELRAAFRKRARVFHPDRGTGNDQDFVRLEYAYRVLNNPAKRRLYDLLLEAGIVQPGLDTGLCPGSDCKPADEGATPTRASALAEHAPFCHEGSDRLLAQPSAADSTLVSDQTQGHEPIEQS